MWYNVDATWGDTSKGYFNKGYFLLGSATFDPTHTRNSDYTSQEFISSHPTSTFDYKPF